MIVILPTFNRDVYAIPVSCFENPGCVTFHSVNEDGEDNGRMAVCEKYSAGCAVRLYAEGIAGDNLLIHDLDCPDAGEAGWWATEWCKGTV